MERHDLLNAFKQQFTVQFQITLTSIKKIQGNVISEIALVNYSKYIISQNS